MSASPPGPFSADGLDVVVRRLQAAHPLTAQDIALLHQGCGPPEPHRAGAELGGATRRMLLSGWAARGRVLADERRQIAGFLLPGDPIDLADQAEPRLHRTLALTRGATVDASMLAARMASGDPAYDRLRRAIAAADRAEAVRQVDHIVRLGAMEAYAAMGHLLLELRARCVVVGLVEDERFPLQVSQDVLGEALGLSQVHANRVLAQLRRDGLVELGPGWARLLDIPRLAAVAAAEACA